MNHVDRTQTVARRQHAVESAGGSAALDVSQHDGARLEARPLLDLTRENVGDAAQFRMTEFIFAHVLQDGGARASIGGKLCAFRHNDDRKITPTLMPLANRFGHLVNVEGPLGNQNYVGAAGDAAVQRDPARVASHYLHYHHAVVGLGSCVKTIDRFTHHIAGGIESESVVRSAQIVVDGLGNAYHVQAFFVKLLGNRQRIVSADGDQG